MDNIEIKDKLLNFFLEKLEIDFVNGEVSTDENLIESGYVDSLSFLVIITFINKTFKVKVSLEDIENEALVTLDNIVSFVKSNVA